MNAPPFASPAWTPESRIRRAARTAGRALAAGAVAGALVCFLVLVRMLESSPPDRTIRRIETLDAVALPAPPPPPPPEAETPPPPPPPALPRLEVRLDSPAPALKAVIDRTLDLSMLTADFALEAVPALAPPVSVPLERTARPAPVSPSSSGPPRQVVKSSYSVGELDGKPQLLNSPDVAYPSSLLRQGIREGRATVEIAISTSGSVSVRSLVACSHPEFAAMARSFASRARFTVPRKNGQAVTAVYRWQLILRP